METLTALIVRTQEGTNRTQISLIFTDILIGANVRVTLNEYKTKDFFIHANQKLYDRFSVGANSILSETLWGLTLKFIAMLSLYLSTVQIASRVLKK